MFSAGGLPWGRKNGMKRKHGSTGPTRAYMTGGGSPGFPGSGGIGVWSVAEQSPGLGAWRRWSGGGPERRRPEAAGDAAWSRASAVPRPGQADKVVAPGWWYSVARRATGQGGGRATGRPRSEGSHGRAAAIRKNVRRHARDRLPLLHTLGLRLGLLPGPGSAPLGLAGRWHHGCGAAVPHGGAAAMAPGRGCWT